MENHIFYIAMIILIEPLFKNIIALFFNLEYFIHIVINYNIFIVLLQLVYVDGVSA